MIKTGQIPEEGKGFLYYLKN